MGLKAWANTNGTVWTAPSGSIVTSLVDHDNPLGIRPYTMRFQFSDYSYDPTSESWIDGSYWTQVSSSPNVWDYTHVTNSWNVGGSTNGEFRTRFTDHGNLVTVLGGNLVGVTSAAYLFYGNTALIGVNSLDTSTINDFKFAFSYCSVLPSIPLLDLSSCIEISSLCSQCTSLTTVPAIDYSHVQKADTVFFACYNLTTVPAMDLRNATTVNALFNYCTSLTTVGALNTPLTKDFSKIFDGCTALSSAPTMDTSSAEKLTYAFHSCSSLTQAPSLNTRYCTDFSYMFNGASSLQSVPLYNTVNADNVKSMFDTCRAVSSGALSLYTQMSTQTVPPTKYDRCFFYCGYDTVTGHQELEQIPSSWGGLASD